MDYWSDEPFDFIYADYIFEDDDFAWLDHYWAMLKEHGVFAVHSDHQNYHKLHAHAENLKGFVFINQLITYQNWGGRPKDRFGQKHDLILVFSKGKHKYFDSDAVQIPKQMINPSFNPSGRTTTTPNLGNFSTTSGERIKNFSGKNISWQKPLKIMRRLMYAFVPRGSRVCDPFMGSGTTGEVARELDCDFVGIEKDIERFILAMARLNVDK